MGSLLSSISSQLAVRSITLGTLFPVVLFTVLNILIIGPMISWPRIATYFPRALPIGEEKWSVVTLTLIVVAITGILYNFNTAIIRLYEGYPWKDSFIGSRFTRSKVRKLRKAKALQAALRAMQRKLLAANPQDPIASELLNARMPIALLLNNGLPDRDNLVLPTRLGNTIRTFERYPNIAYGMDAIALWPLLVSKIESNAAASLDNTKTSFDFMLHCSFLSSLTSMTAIAIGLSDPAPLSYAHTLSWIWPAALFLILARIFYEGTVGRAAAWGTQVKSVFDLYRLDLLAKLGYQQKPKSVAEERALWSAISNQILYCFILRPDDLRTPYADARTQVLEPTDVRIEANREIENARGPKVTVRVVVQNSDPASRTARKVTLAETVPDGLKYALGSIAVSAGPCKLLALKPLTVELGELQKGESYIVRYDTEPATL